MYPLYYICMVGLIVGAYFLGNINFSILISKLNHSDVRTKGSGNPGTMNMLRSYGIGLGVLTLVLDAIKGAVPALLGWWLLGENPAYSMGEMFTFGADKIGLYVGGISSVIGHVFPVVYKFKGGKGVATTIGICLVASPVLSLVAFALAVAFFLTVKIGSLTSFIAISIPLIYCATIAFMQLRIGEAILAIVILLMVIIAHHGNIKRIFKGEEKQIVMFGKNKTAKKIREEEKTR